MRKVKMLFNSDKSWKGHLETPHRNGILTRYNQIKPRYKAKFILLIRNVAKQAL